jgi:polyribonucleotide nucleotidyltransferase
MSVDQDCSPEIAGMLGASAAVAISDIPWNGPLAGVVVGYDGSKYLFNPTSKERDTSLMHVTVAATKEKVVMIEAAAKEIPEDVMYEGIMQAHAYVQLSMT